MPSFSKIAAGAALFVAAQANPVDLVERQSCPSIQIFGARETTAPAGFGTAGVVVNLVLAAYPGSQATAIDYPACGGQSSCGGASYSSSVATGTAAIAKAVNDFAARCPSSQIVIVGYSQGGEISDNAVCGGGDSPQGLTSTSANTINAAALAQVKAVIEMGSPRFVSGSSYNVGTCTSGGFSARPAGYNCPSASKLRSYCDQADPYCCKGSDANTHQGYGTEYGQNALTFIKSKLSSSSGGGGAVTVAPASTTPAGSKPTTSPPATGSGTVAKYGQCGGTGYTGPTTCASGSTCKAQSSYYSQCL